MADIDLSQMNKLIVDMAGVPAEAAVGARVAVGKTTEDIVADAIIFAPVDTGFLEGSIGADFDTDRLGSEIGPTAEYGIYVELGTARMAPAAYMGPAFDRHAGDLDKALGQLIDRFLG